MKKVALVTGASQGIGKGIADALCDAGYEVVRVSRHPECDGDDHFRCDISSAGDRAALAEFIDKKYGRLDLLSLPRQAGKCPGKRAHNTFFRSRTAIEQLHMNCR